MKVQLVDDPTKTYTVVGYAAMNNIVAILHEESTGLLVAHPLSKLKVIKEATKRLGPIGPGRP